jgi:hypothetical protein
MLRNEASAGHMTTNRDQEKVRSNIPLAQFCNMQ